MNDPQLLSLNSGPRLSRAEAADQSDYLMCGPPRDPGSIDDHTLSGPIEIVEDAKDKFEPVATFALCSGGNDSMVLLDMARRFGWAPNGVAHVNTGTGVPETTEFVRNICGEWDIPFVELHPPKSFEELFLEDPIIDGLPGPGMHRIAYARLKQRALRELVKAAKTSWRSRVVLLTGIRHDESQIRMGYKESIVDRDGAAVWVNPLYWWSNDTMQQYRTERGLPENPVSANLHMSGECLCGCFAKPNELEEIRFFYPEVAARIEGWQQRAAERGLTYCTWGQRRGKDDPAKARLCKQCVGQTEMFEEVG